MSGFAIKWDDKKRLAALEQELAEARAQRDEYRESGAANLAVLRDENAQLESALRQRHLALRLAIVAALNSDILVAALEADHE